MARVLQLTAFTDWLKNESSGYSESSVIPEYRRAQDTGLIAWMPSNGWAQVPIDDEDKDRIYQGNILGSIIQLEEDLEKHRKPGGKKVEISEEEEAELQKVINMQTRLQISIPVINNERILSTTRQTISVWTADMLEHDVVGHSLKFTHSEKEAAQALFDKLPTYQDIAKNTVEQRMAQAKPKASLIDRLFGR